MKLTQPSTYDPTPFLLEMGYLAEEAKRYVVNYPLTYDVEKDDLIEVRRVSRGRRLFVRVTRAGKVIYRGTCVHVGKTE